MKLAYKSLSPLFLGIGLIALTSTSWAEPPATPEGTIHVPAFDLPPSSHLNEEANAALKRQAQQALPVMSKCPIQLKKVVTAEEAVTFRKCFDDDARLTAERHKAIYKVNIEPLTVGGVSSEAITPAEGIAPNNRQRVLINVHGGGYFVGAVWVGQIESIPIASLGKIKVVSVNYRMAPEHYFPAASDDIVAVYKALLKEYRPENIGIYGCSAGGALVGQSLARFQKEGLPTPAAAGIFCAGTYASTGNTDSGVLSHAIFNTLKAMPKGADYMKTAAPNDPLGRPGISDAVMAKFPPTLLVTATRDQSMSSAALTHTQLERLGVKSELFVWEGLGHAFHYNPELPQSREVYNVTVRFFNEYLGRKK